MIYQIQVNREGNWKNVGPVFTEEKKVQAAYMCLMARWMEKNKDSSEEDMQLCANLFVANCRVEVRDGERVGFIGVQAYVEKEHHTHH